MRVLVVHNRYRPTAPSGENRVVDQETEALTARGVEVSRFERHSEEIAGWSWSRRAAVPARLLWSEESRRGLLAELGRSRPDVVHVHNTFPLVTPSVLHACRAAGVPVVATVHNYKLTCASGELFRDGEVCHECLGGLGLPALRHGCYRGSRLATLPVVAATATHRSTWRSQVSAYVFISAAQRDLLAGLGLAPERSFVKHNFVPDPGPGDQPVQHRVAFVGRLDTAKGARLVMQAWDTFRAGRPGSSLRLVVAGGGDLAAELERWAAGHPSVGFAGLLPRAEASRILAGSRAALVPSRWQETFGMVAVEAMAAGTAPLASAHGAFPELVTPGTDGALFDPSDPAALVGLLEQVDDRPEQWDGYGRQARETYLDRFAVEPNISRLLEIYRFAIDHPVGGSDRPGAREPIPTTEPR